MPTPGSASSRIKAICRHSISTTSNPAAMRAAGLMAGETWSVTPNKCGTRSSPLNILLPQIRRFENDNRLLINFETALSGYPMATSSAYGQGTFCVLAVPDDFADLYRLPPSVLNQIRTL